LTAAKAPPRMRNVVIATLGNIIEWFDFTIYGFFALTISAVFFSISDPKLGLLASFATFGVGFGARPIGAFIFGRLGDTRGRRFVLIASISMMAAGSFMIAVAPGYVTAGLWGVVVLVAGRLLQGLSAGAEFGTSIAYLIEWAPAHRRGLFGSFQQVGAGLGLLLGALMAAVLNSMLDPGQMRDWGWRIPFALGGVLALVALLLRLKLEETPEFRAADRSAEPLTAGGASVIVPVLQNIGIVALWSVSVFASVVYMPTFAVQHGGMAPGQALWASVIALLAMLFAIPLAGIATDRFGARPVILASAVGYILFAWPGFALVVAGHSLASTMVVLVLFATLSGVISGAGPVAIASLFRTNMRTTWTSIASAIATTCFGGFAPFIATLLIAGTGTKAAPAYYITGVAVLTAITALSLARRASP
jgi:MHS family proline/betaine transporter-like MFS transporter